MTLSAIVAASENNVIGRNNDLPWRLPDDLKYFRDTTLGHPVIMGRKNYDSGPFPLPGRTNIVITRDPLLYLSGCHVTPSLSAAIEKAKSYANDEIFIIGGGMIYELAMPIIDKLYLTRVHTQIAGDAFFPEINPEEWRLTSERYHAKDDRHPYDFTYLVYERVVP